MRIKNNFAALIFIAAIFYFMAAVLAGFASTLVDKAKGVIIVSRTLNWQALYPFENNNEKSNSSVESEPTPLQKINRKIMQAVNTRKQKIEGYATEKMTGYMHLIETARKYDALIKWNVAPMSEYNNIIELSDGSFSGLTESMDVIYSAQNTVRLANFCNENNINFLYASAPAKICRYDDAKISGIIDFANQNADKFFDILEYNNIKYLDFREILHAEKLNHHNLFFKTDSHWRPEAGLWAARNILQFMRDEFKYNVDPSLLNPENFNTVNYPEWFLGAQGKKLTLSRAKPEDFHLLYPKFKTLIRYEDIPSGIDATGDFNLMYNMNLFKAKNYYADSVYNAYPGGVMARKYNELADNNVKILLLRDSFAQVVIPFLTLGIKQLDILDLRDFRGSVQTYIKINKPDLVVVLYNIAMIGRDDVNWPRNIFDMR